MDLSAVTCGAQRATFCDAKQISRAGQVTRAHRNGCPMPARAPRARAAPALRGAGAQRAHPPGGHDPCLKPRDC